MKKPVDEFRVKRITLGRPHLWVNVVVCVDKKAVRDGAGPETKRSNAMAVFMPFLTQDYRDIRPCRRGCVGEIRVPLSRKMELFALHESIHAAFEVSRYRMNWPANDESTREEFIVRASEYIFEQIQKRFRERNYYR